ncbi:hypothetical protein LX36DRAFT_231332 [Colletotrichum falcatum]|nr:hypothetical protein LX36DRAFT_231332 [Colletotrichum falcatum]
MQARSKVKRKKDGWGKKIHYDWKRHPSNEGSSSVTPSPFPESPRQLPPISLTTLRLPVCSSARRRERWEGALTNPRGKPYCESRAPRCSLCPPHPPLGKKHSAQD